MICIKQVIRVFQVLGYLFIGKLSIEKLAKNKANNRAHSIEESVKIRHKT